MKGQLKASTPEEYLAQLEEPRKSEIAALDALVRKAAPKLAPFIHIGILAYGRQGDWFRIGIASNKNYISLYVGDVAQGYKDALPKASIGRACVRFRKLGDLDQAALKKLIRQAAQAAVKV
jgi:uncharacterized protein YdhG (YjbR/CyaY superfamily)